MKDKRRKPKPAAQEPRPASPPQETASPPPDEERSRGSGELMTKISASAGVIGAMVLAMLVNVYGARHYHRWDWTRGGLYTLSDATLTTLHGLAEPVKVIVLLPSSNPVNGEPLTLAVMHLLDAYRGETGELSVELLDPDARPADFLAVAKRYGIDSDKEEGRTIASAAAVVIRGERSEIVRQQELVQIDAEDDLRHRPRLEQAFTGAIRAVTSSDHPRACFTTGHGEVPSAPLRDHLTRNGYEVTSVEPAHAGSPPSLDGCKMLVIAAPAEKVPADDAARYQAYFEKGGSVLLAAGPTSDSADRDFLDLGLGGLLGAAGLALDHDYVFELDPRARPAQSRGDIFAPSVKPHPSTQSAVRLAARSVVPIVGAVSSISPTGAGAAAVMPLLVTSDQAFGMVDFFARMKAGEANAPTPAGNDRKGPLDVAVASELPAPPGSGAAHGGRMIAAGSASFVDDGAWQNEALRGTVVFVEGAIGWLTARPPILDIPPKPAFTAGLHVTEEWLGRTLRYTVAYMPLAAALLGFAVWLRRRGEKRGTGKEPKA
jgi:hypothetical protein